MRIRSAQPLGEYDPGSAGQSPPEDPQHRRVGHGSGAEEPSSYPYTEAARCPCRLYDCSSSWDLHAVATPHIALPRTASFSIRSSSLRPSGRLPIAAYGSMGIRRHADPWLVHVSMLRTVGSSSSARVLTNGLRARVRRCVFGVARRRIVRLRWHRSGDDRGEEWAREVSE